ncbi:trigger factor [Clostridium sp. CAG:914]|nr:trigger factor [Clostridium sp. CAG:914]
MREEVNFKLEGKEWVELQDKAFEKLNKKANIDGFRPGKAPRDIFEKKYGKQEIILEAADEATNKEYKRLLGENKITPIIEPKVELIKCDSDTLEVKFTFITDPEVTLGEYTNLKVKKEKAKVTKEEVDNSIKELLNEYAEVVVKEGNVESGDIAIIDFAGYKDGVAFEGGTGENYSLTIGSNTFIPGFEDAVIGMAKGEEKDIELTFPEDYMQEDLKGQKVVFKVKVNEIKTRKIPELNKEFFEDLNMEGITDKESLEKDIKEELTHRKEHELEHAYEDACLDKAANNMKIEILPELIDDEAHQMYHEFMDRMKRQGITEELYLKYTNSTEEDLIEKMKDEAKKRIQYRYLLREIIKKENIKITDKEAKEKIKEIAKQYNVTEEEILKEVGTLEAMKMDLAFQKAVELVKANND